MNKNLYAKIFRAIYNSAMPPLACLRIMVVDDHKHIHDVINKVLHRVSDIDVVAHAANGEEALEICATTPMDLILMDVVMPVMDGLDATKAIRERFPHIKILALSSYKDHESVHALLKHGAIGYITKDSLTSELVYILRTAAVGKTVISPDAMEALVSLQPKTLPINRFNLTDRELEILVLMADGLTQQQMASRLSVSLSTMKYHYANIFQKLEVKNSSEAMVVAVKNNLI